MATYVMLMTLTPEGRANAVADPDYLVAIENQLERDGVVTLGVYAVLGPYDFVTLVEAPSNETVARFSLELGVRAGVHVMTLPVIPASRLEDNEKAMEASASVEAPFGAGQAGSRS